MKWRKSFLFAAGFLFLAMPSLRAAEMRVLSAQYGVPRVGKTCDATRILRRACNGVASCRVDADDSLCGDPWPLHPKELIVRYRCGSISTDSNTEPQGYAAHLDCG